MCSWYTYYSVHIVRWITKLLLGYILKCEAYNQSDKQHNLCNSVGKRDS